MKFTPYLMVYKETLPIPKRAIRKSCGWDELNSLLKYYYLNIMQQMLRAPTLLTGIFVDQGKKYPWWRSAIKTTADPLSTHTLRAMYDMGKVPYYIKLKWRLQDLWRKLRG